MHALYTYNGLLLLFIEHTQNGTQYIIYYYYYTIHMKYKHVHTKQ